MRSLVRLLLVAFISLLSNPLTCVCAEPANVDPLRRFYNTQTNEHQYTTTVDEATKWRKLQHLKEQVIVGFVSRTETEGTVRLHRGFKTNGRHVYYLGQRPNIVRTVDDRFKAYVWREGGHGRVGVFCSTWIDGGDVYFDDLIESIDRYSANTLKDLKVNRLRPQLTATFFVHPSPRRQAMIAYQSRTQSGSAAKVAEIADAEQMKAVPVGSGKKIIAASESDDNVLRFTELLLDDPVTSFEMTEDGRHVLFTHQLANRVSVYDVLGGEVTHVIETPAPRSVICRGDKAYVANFGTGTISVFDSSLDWRFASKLRTLKPNIVHLSAARVDKFNEELLVTCHGEGRQASYQDSHVMLVDVRRNLCRNLSSDPLASVSADGALIYTQDSFNLSPSGGIKGWDYNRFTTPGTKRDPVIQGGVSQTPYTYQLVPGSYLFSQNTIFGGSEIQQMPGDFGNLIVPDLAQKVFYTLTADIIRCHNYNAAFSQIELRPVKYPTGYEDITKIVFPVHRIRDYMLDHPVAYTHGNRLYLFVLTATAGRVLTAEAVALKSVDQATQELVNKDASVAGPAKEDTAKMEPPKAGKDSMAAVPNSGDARVAGNASDTRKSFADVIATCERSVVRITTKGNDGDGIGSGFVVDDRGTVVTNCHVLVGANEAQAHFANGETADVLGTLVIDEARDIAVVKIASVDHPAIEISQALPRKGEEIVALGAPLGLAFTATRGIVSAIRSEEEFSKEFGADRAGTWIQVDAALSPGNSGGPLINDQGKVVAMATLASTGVAQNLNFGISAADIKELITGVWTSTLLPLADGAAKMKTPARNRKPEGDASPEISQVPSEAILEYLKTCEQQYAKLLRDLRKEGGRLDSMLQEMKKGETFIPSENRDDGDIVRLQLQRGAKWYFRNDRTKDRAMDFVEERIDELKELTSSLKGANDHQSIVNLAANYGPLLDGRKVGKVGFLSEAVVLSAINHTDVLIDYDGAVYLITLETTAGIGSGEFLQARPAYVVGTATVKSPRGGSAVVTLLRSVPKADLASVAPSKPPIKPASDSGQDKQVQPNDSLQSPEPVRIWRDKSDKYSITATLVDFDSKAVQLRKEDGTIVSVPTVNLSQEDIDYLKQKWQKKQATSVK
ncbi:MAG TPA: hypothetical protein DDZ51_13845 [Planctomycetaceae bacterium]|nr:hypothetical protein [Planctomycetaceae bacterium]